MPHIPCEKCRHAIYWRMIDGDREWVYVYEVICDLRHKPARRCSDYSKKTLIWKLRKRFLKQEESPR